MQILAALARALHFDRAERDHLFRLGGHAAPERVTADLHVSPGMQRILERLTDTPAQVVTELGETLVQTEPARALLGDARELSGLRRATVYRWFTEPESRDVYALADHNLRGTRLSPSCVPCTHGPATARARARSSPNSSG